jgi:hypothetical protein
LKRASGRDSCAMITLLFRPAGKSKDAPYTAFG